MTDHPNLSVVVPVYNDAVGLQATLNSLTTQNSPSNKYEVLVVDNGSTDTTTKMIEEFEQEFPNIVAGYEETTIQSSYAARNKGIEKASGEITAFVDADMTVTETWIEDLQNVFDDTDIDYLGYNVEMIIPDSEETYWAQYDAAMGLPVEHYLKTKQFAPTCALAVRRDVFDIVGKFDQTLVSGGDKEFGRRVYDAKLTMGYTDRIVVRHPARTTLRAHLKKAVRIGRGQAQLWHSHNLALEPLSVMRWLPPNPLRVQKRARQNDDFFVTLYLIESVLKYCQSLSALIEAVRLFRRAN